ncbi:MAG: EFR1 family ferrodoxin [Spirochaetales bacterium]|nr:EFR1 family ferrodoxin [Spirochaetales bacterium]
MNEKNLLIKIVFFSGTGGVRRVAMELQKQCLHRNDKCVIEEIRVDLLKQDQEPCSAETHILDFVFLLYPVHAFDAPEIVYRWIDRQEGSGLRAIVVSVSGGGSGWPNIGTRSEIKEALENRGFAIFYEKMLIMPSNWLVTPCDDGAIALLKILPFKIKKILDDICKGKQSLLSEKKGLFQRWISLMEKKHCSGFVKTIKIADTCNGCGWCARHCALENIVIENKKPRFLDQCIMCFQCVYGCPQKALVSRHFQVLQQGYDLDALEKRMAGRSLKPLDQCFKGIFWRSVREYCESVD